MGTRSWSGIDVHQCRLSPQSSNLYALRLSALVRLWRHGPERKLYGPLGVSGKKNRAKLPTCVTKKIAEMYPDAEGTPTKVGYQQDAE
jgi:hypothetical protein